MNAWNPKLKRNPAVAVLNQPHSGYRLTFCFATGAAFGPRIFHQPNV
jgi:hypothetical protein